MADEGTLPEHGIDEGKMVSYETFLTQKNDDFQSVKNRSLDGA